MKKREEACGTFYLDIGQRSLKIFRDREKHKDGDNKEEISDQGKEPEREETGSRCIG